ncbi:LacI family DNA-binding transcriptional regulator [Paenibacillus methanolicus]|uniref:LacI family transcriptional regulator n=1 Tax=Paenibacillus methanolicus TaxID=582686 RepID=A0A5S5CH12_9BACL|nr:LacI family DNA-binding transcriptional regulator [Paenibacillus methanolicus]TYP79002.1 LacI family transcriptional regulator [Paenibacillus methanolicus]
MSRITIRDVARIANVSVTTVSNVLNKTGRTSPETMRKVEQVMEELQFVPSTSARNLRDKKSHLIGVIVPFLEKGRLKDNPFYWQLLSAIEEGTRSHQFHLILFGADENESFSFVHERHLDGLIVIGTFDNSPVLERLLQLNVPCVFMDSYLSDPKLAQVNIDDQAGGHLGTKHLLGLGHRRIAVLSGVLQHNGVSHERWLGYRRALEEAGIPYDPSLVLQEPVSLEGGYHAGLKAATLPAEERFTAVFAFSDVGAIGFMKAMHDLGISVPDQMSIVGFDDIFLSPYIPVSITTVKQDLIEKGQAAVNMLLSQIHGESTDNCKHVLPVSLSVRNSTKAL